MLNKKNQFKSSAIRPQETFIFMGLGNADPAYANTYHNAGQLALDYLVAHLPLDKEASGEKTGFAFVKSANGWIFAKPLCAMNESGPYVKRAMRHFGKKPNQLVLLHDESDIELGSYKISKDSGAAGHRGVQSVIDVLGTKEFIRIRIGIRAKTEKRKAIEFVLKKITSVHKKILEATFEKIAEEVSGWVQ